jgi:putative nucleotidyltransferase with HDIG domain
VALQFAPVPSSRIDHPSSSALLVSALARTMRSRDPRTYEHGERVRDYAINIARALGMTDRHALDAIAGAAVVHDVGKLGIHDEVLNKPGPLTPAEYELVKQHVTIGADLIASALLPRELALIVRHHHERWDGTGYPDGLRGAAIPPGARIVAIADCFDSLTSARPYRDVLSEADAAQWILQQRGSAFDPTFTDAFIQTLPAMRTVVQMPRRAYGPVR